MEASDTICIQWQLVGRVVGVVAWLPNRFKFNRKNFIYTVTDHCHTAVTVQS